MIALVMITLALFISACATLSRHASSEGQLSLSAPKAEGSSLININTATTQELEKLPGVGKVTAERIVAHRQQYGAFRRAEHLMMVRGISDGRFRTIRPMIVVE